MKKIALFFILALIIFSLASCGDSKTDNVTTPDIDSEDTNKPSEDVNTPDEKQEIEISGLTFSNAEYTYDGTEKALSVNGELPDGVSITYSGIRCGTDAGEYTATATISGDGYKTLTLSAKLTIKKADIVGISVDANQSVKENESKQKPVFSGSLPSGVEVKYYFDTVESAGKTEAGVYNVRIVFSGKNYNDLVFDVNFKIESTLDLSMVASTVIDSFGSVPDVWEFLPSSFAPKNYTISTSTINYENFVSVSDIPQNGMGKQFRMVYNVLTQIDVAMPYVNRIYGSMNLIKSVYTNFLDDSPEDYKRFTDTVAGITFTIELSESSYVLKASVDNVEIVIFSNLAEKTYGARIQLSESTILKYEVSEDKLTIGVDILNSGARLVTFERNDKSVTGMIYEFLTLGDKNLISNSAMIEIGDSYTVIIGTKGDFLLASEGRNSEVYDNNTGRFLGSEVKEDYDKANYNTYWFPISYLEGIVSIKKIDKMNVKNPDTIYINDSSDTIHTTLYGGFSGKMLSRRYDIEFKTMYFFIYDEDTESYEEVSLEIPMLFVQEEHIGTFNNDFNSENEDALTYGKAKLLVSNSTINAISYGYTELLPIYNTNADLVTHEAVTEWCKK